MLAGHDGTPDRLRDHHLLDVVEQGTDVCRLDAHTMRPWHARPGQLYRAAALVHRLLEAEPPPAPDLLEQGGDVVVEGECRLTITSPASSPAS